MIQEEFECLQIVIAIESNCASYYIGAMIFLISNNSICNDFALYNNFKKEFWRLFLYIPFFKEFRG